METKNLNTSGLMQVIDTLSMPDSYQLVYHSTLASEEMLSVNSIKEIMEVIKEILFPGYFGNNAVRVDTIRFHTGIRVDKLYQLLLTQLRRGFCFECGHDEFDKCEECNINVSEITLKFISGLPEIRRLLATDVQAILKYDPAARSSSEIIFAYPGIKAITNYRVAHDLFRLNVPIIPRILTELAHSETGIDIHPGAKIDEYFCIDHGQEWLSEKLPLSGKM